MQQYKYHLNREQQQELMRFGKTLKGKDEVIQPILHQRLLHLTFAKPFLLPRQVRWWYTMYLDYENDVPEWLYDALTDIAEE